MPFQMLLLIPLILSIITFHPGAVALPDNDLDRMLQGIHLNMSFAECLERLPDAVYSDAESRNSAPSPDRPEALLITHGADPFLGIRAFANIGFQEAKLYELVAVWTGDEKEVAARCRRFLKALCERHGEKYERKSLYVYPQSEEERAVAVWLWQDKDSVSLGFYTPPAPGSDQATASLSFAQFRPDAEFLQDVFSRHAVTEEKAAAAWKQMDTILDP